jgi:hypothetical protein
VETPKAQIDLQEFKKFCKDTLKDLKSVENAAKKAGVRPTRKRAAGYTTARTAPVDPMKKLQAARKGLEQLQDLMRKFQDQGLCGSMYCDFELKVPTRAPRGAAAAQPQLTFRRLKRAKAKQPK